MSLKPYFFGEPLCFGCFDDDGDTDGEGESDPAGLVGGGVTDGCGAGPSLSAAATAALYAASVLSICWPFTKIVGVARIPFFEPSSVIASTNALCVSCATHLSKFVRS